MQSPYLDLHLHTNCSDGIYSYEELFLLLKSEKVGFCSITDHDSTEHLPNMQEEAQKKKIAFLPGVEISTFFEGGEVHILGYGFSTTDKQFQQFIHERFEKRTRRTAGMLVLLNRLGYELNYEDVLNQSPGPYVGRPNIARALKSKGYIRETSEAFTRDLIGNQGKAYVPPSECHPSEAITAIKNAGGVAVLAHPGIYTSEEATESKYGLENSQLLRLKEFGLDGVEVYHSRHSYADTQKYSKICQELNLKQTMGSDFHEGMYFPIHWQVPNPVLEETLLWLKDRFSFY